MQKLVSTLLRNDKWRFEMKDYLQLKFNLIVRKYHTMGAQWLSNKKIRFIITKYFNITHKLRLPQLLELTTGFKIKVQFLYILYCIIRNYMVLFLHILDWHPMNAMPFQFMPFDICT